MDEMLPIAWSDLETPRSPPCPRGREILLQILVEIEAIAEIADSVLTRSPHLLAWGLRCRGVPYRPREWFGPPGVTERMAWSRAALRLERDGYVERILEPLRNRVTHLVPTVAGLCWALEASPAADRDAVEASLSRVEWGGHLLAALGEDPLPS